MESKGLPIKSLDQWDSSRDVLIGRGMVSGEIPERATRRRPHETPRRSVYFCQDPVTKHNSLVWIEGKFYDVRHDCPPSVALLWATKKAPTPRRPLSDFKEYGVSNASPEQFAAYIARESLRRHINGLRNKPPVDYAEEETLP